MAARRSSTPLSPSPRKGRISAARASRFPTLSVYTISPFLKALNLQKINHFVGICTDKCPKSCRVVSYNAGSRNLSFFDISLRRLARGTVPPRFFLSGFGNLGKEIDSKTSSSSRTTRTLRAFGSPRYGN